MRSKNSIPEYVFRGTTIGFPGGTNIQKLKYSCTTCSPIKAALFAMECARTHPESAVVYIIKTRKISHLNPEGNFLKKYEEELAWPLLPKDLYAISEGYVTIQVMLDLLKAKKIAIESSVSLENLTRLLKESKKMSDTQIQSLVKDIVIQNKLVN